MEINEPRRSKAWSDELPGILGFATLWGAFWSLGMVLLSGPVLPVRVRPLMVLSYGAIGFMTGGVFAVALAYHGRTRDPTESGVSGLGFLRQQVALAVAHVLGTIWITLNTIRFVISGGNVFFAVPTVHEMVVVSYLASFVLPIWAAVVTIMRQSTDVQKHKLFFMADVVIIPLVLGLMMMASD